MVIQQVRVLFQREYDHRLGMKKATVTLCSEYTGRQWPFGLLRVVADCISYLPAGERKLGRLSPDGGDIASILHKKM
jgi:hypothetical protein